MAMVQQKYVATLKFTFQDFKQEPIPDLVKNIWLYSGEHG